MANLQKRLDVTELDFDSIKSNLITYFKSTEPFKDWDYTGSGLNQLLDVLAYNTHYNAMLAHTAVNESFIDTAQLRTSVVSNAKLLGYIPRSKSSPTIDVTVQFGKDLTGEENSGTSIRLDKGATFKTAYGGDSYIYTTLDDYLLEYNTATSRYTNNNITLREGSLRINRFPVSNSFEKTVYVIDDDNIDTSTLIVRIYDNKNSTVSEQYKNFTSIEQTHESFLATEALYFLSENTYGKYQISFSNNNIFGKKPPNLGVVEIEYLTTTGSLSNGAHTFKFVGTPPQYASTTALVTPKSTTLNGVTVAGKSFGGNEKESIDSIRLNAPAAFVTQNRAVTADDYKSLIYSKFSFAKSIAVWGGENNIPVQYGNVFISIQPQQTEDSNNTEQVLTGEEKRIVLSFLDSKKILSITPVLVDPERVSLVLDVLFKYNNNLGLLSTNQLQNKVRNVIEQFNSDYLDSFEKVFRHSTLLKTIDTCDSSILNSLVRVFVSKTFKVENESNPKVPKRIILDFGTPLTVIDGKTIAQSDGWLLKGYKVYLGDEPSNVEGIRNVFRYTLEAGKISKFKDNNGIDVPSIGTIDLEKGILSIEGLIADDGQELETFNIDVIPESNDIASKRNQILAINTNRLNVTAEIDTIATGGSSRTIDYKPFSRER